MLGHRCDISRAAILILFSFASQSYAPFVSAAIVKDRIVGRIACYGETCLKTVAAKNIADKDEYEYLDPKLFPHQSLRPQYRKPIRFVDLENIDMDEPMSENFVVGDFMNIERGRYGIFSPTVAAILQSIRNEIDKPITINSGYRSPGHNSQTGGSALWSRHMYGDAVDFTTPNANFKQLQNLCRQYGASFTLIYKAHIHCDWRLLSLPTEFYGPAQALTANDFADVMASQAELVIRRENAETVTLAATLTQLEDEDDTPIYEWHITLPNQRVIDGANAEITLPRMSGRYIINVKVGGSIAITRSLDL